MHDQAMKPDLTPSNLLAAYCVGIFPMADDTGEIHWLAPDPRAVMDLNAFHVTRSLRTTVRRETFQIRLNTAFRRVMAACAEREEGTWISPDILRAYSRLHQFGYAHSVEAWREGKLVGGLYGVAIEGAFFGESMFHRERDASKVALVRLVERLRDRGFVLLDVQFLTQHLRSFGAVEIPRSEYRRRLRKALRLPCVFGSKPPVPPASFVKVDSAHE